MGNYDDAIRSTLVCPKCGAANRPGATYIELFTGFIAFCIVCAHRGPIETFQQKEQP